MSIVTPRIASGFPEYLPEDQMEFNRLRSIIEETYQKYGFSPIDTPDLELKEVLLAKGGGETDQQVYEFTRGRNDFVMRFDLTVPLARYAAEHQNELVFPFRRYHIGKVHRAERAQAGRFREFYQCDIDVIGTNSPLVDAEFPAIISEVFERFNFGEFVVRINDRRILNGFFKHIGLDECKSEVMRVVDKVEKLSKQEFSDTLVKVGLDDGQISKLASFTSITGDNDQVLAALSELGIDDSDFVEGLKNLTTVINTLRLFGVSEKRFRLDLKIARGLDYYTGTVYETNLVDYPELGSVCSGGRFDDLAGHYTTTNLPGVGISIGLSRLFYKLKEIGVIESAKKTPATVVVLPLSEAEFDIAIQASAVLRTANVSNILYTELNNLKKKLRYADQMGFDYAVIIGETERLNDGAMVKNLSNGDSKFVKLADLADMV